MPNVTPPGSSPPPVSGSVEDPQQLDRAETLSYSRTFPESAPVPGLPEQREGVLERPEVVEVNHGSERLNKGEEKTSGDDERACSQARNRDEVIKEIGTSSAAFIGPTCRPQSAIEDELSEFYKELEQIDQRDAVDGSSERASQFCTPAVKDKGSDQRYRSFPATRPRTDYRNTPQWRPQSYDVTCDWSNSHRYPNQWHLPPPNFYFYPPNPTPPLYSQPQTHQYFWLGPDVRLASSHSPAPYEVFKLWRYEEQNYQDVNQHERSEGPSLVLILMRGVPGSGKSTLARHISTSGPSGLILSTDDYFHQKDGYHFEPTLLGAAHDWNQSRAKKAMLDGRTPVIIDNTNVQAWEMKPYVAVALETGYRVEFVEPDTSWKRDPVELEKRNHHGVSRETIANMLDRFELPVSVDIVMNSCEPSHKRKENHSRPYR
ncbi:NEDD4-binding protein 2-like 2 [Ictalurus punctatus]|uniref:NEDD4-binding protein 2-like 2 n=1 Tax=Ictalurus punctatus TaxID=7998 RepID=A0A2D0SX36_ICTPU|nr:NEDD4-binding protein 2-like 2 [Ictalurus punctatus]XP_053543428.1 NEDD4-binding protein 2-like 2 [Ictalurus punctatus]